MLAVSRLLSRCGNFFVMDLYSRNRDGIPSFDADASKGVGKIRVPLVPGVEAGSAVLDVEIDTGLQDRVLGGVAINADPG